MKKYTILIPDVIPPPASIEKKIFGRNCEVMAPLAAKNSDVKESVWRRCNAILAFDELDYDRELIEKLENCKVIVREGVGYDNVDTEAAAERGITVCNIPDYGTEEVADHTIALLLSLARGLEEYTALLRKRKWVRQNPHTFRLGGKTLGIIGLGRIGTAVAFRAKALNLRVIFFDPYIRDGYDKALGVARVNSLKELARQSDIATIHTPLTSETHGMIGADFFKNARKGLVLLNTARGAIIDIATLYKAMKDGTVSACGLDVLPKEPSDGTQKLVVEYEKGAKWLSGRLIVTPHIAFFSPQAYEEMRTKAALEAKRVLDGAVPRNPVNNPCR